MDRAWGKELNAGIMLIYMTLIAVICLIFLILNYNNKFIYVVSGWNISIFAMTIVGVIYLSKNITYITPIPLEYKLYQMLHSIKIDFFSLTRMYNFFFVAFMVMSVFFVMLFRRVRVYKILLSLLPALIFMCITDYTVKYNAYIESFYNPNSIHVYMGKISNIIGNIIFAGYMIIPNILLLISMIKTKIFTMRRYLAVLGISSLLIDLFVYFIFIRGYFSCIWFSNVDVWKIPTISYSIKYYTIVPFLLSIILLITLMLLYIFNFMDCITITNRKKSIKGSKFLRNNLSMMLHTYKNAFVAVGQQNNLAKMNLSHENIKDAEDNLEYITEFVDEYLLKLEKSLRFLRGNAVFPRDINIIDCIDGAIKSCQNDTIEFHKRFQIEAARVHADFDSIKEVFVNLFLNAAEARQENAEKTQIEIDIICENLYIMVSVKDYGRGIPGDEIEKIFQPFYTTKARTRAGGVGLAYVKNILTKSNGEIRVVSTVGEFTEFLIVLPNKRLPNVIRN